MSFDVDVETKLGDFTIAVTFSVGSGITALFGPSGAGKTSILNMIAGVLKPARGRIAVDGQVLFDSNQRINLKPNHRRVGYIFQDARLFPHLSVRGNLLYGYRCTPPAQRYVELDPMITLLGIRHLLDRRPASLSGGEQQRVAIGRAILASPRVLLLDEPFAALDRARKQEIMPYIERLRDELKIPMLYVTHFQAEVDRLAGAIVRVEKGYLAKG